MLTDKLSSLPNCDVPWAETVGARDTHWSSTLVCHPPSFPYRVDAGDKSFLHLSPTRVGGDALA